MMLLAPCPLLLLLLLLLLAVTVATVAVYRSVRCMCRLPPIDKASRGVDHGRGSQQLPPPHAPGPARRAP
jgi:hypothetical protein